MYIGLAIIYFRLIIIFKNSKADNIAYGKRVQFCDKLYLSERINDENVINLEVVKAKCGRNAYIDIIFEPNPVRIKSVTVYEGLGSRGQLDGFVVRLLVDRNFVLCNRFPYVGRGPGNPMRVECPWHVGPASRVRIESARDDGFYISEIKVENLCSLPLRGPCTPCDTSPCTEEYMMCYNVGRTYRCRCQPGYQNIRGRCYVAPKPTSTTTTYVLPRPTIKTTTLAPLTEITRRRTPTTSTVATTNTTTYQTTSTDLPDEMPCVMLDGFCDCLPGYVLVENATCKWDPAFRYPRDYEIINYFSYLMFGVISFVIGTQLIWMCLSYKETSDSTSS